VRWLQGADLPLVHCVVGNAIDADLAVAPALRACPLDALVKILRLAHRPHIEIAGGTTGAARVDTHTCISFRHPFLWINQFPVLVFVARSLQHFRRGFGQPRPISFVAFLKGKPLGVGAIAQDDRKFAAARRAKYVGT
jgi:hypothetical protein